MEVSGQLHAPAALPLRKELPVPNGSEVGSAPESVLSIENKVVRSLFEIMRAAVTGDLRKLPYKELQNFLFW
jgi:hypothetical protein